MPFIVDKVTGNAKHTSDDFIVCDDLGGKDFPMTITKVESKEAVLQEGRKCERIHVYFKGAKKPLLLNATNTRSIISLYGKKAKDWVGKVVTLYPTRCRMKGVTTDCIRIRAGVADAPVPPTEEPLDDLSQGVPEEQ